MSYSYSSTKNSLIIFLIFCEFISLIVANNNNASAIYFPTADEDNNSHQIYKTSPENNISIRTLQELRGTRIYEHYIDNIIARGITKLTLDFNRFLITQKKQNINNNNNNNVVFSPLSITNVLALIMMGANGDTFKEITKFWGLQTGIPDIDKKSQIVHEQFGRMLRKLNKTDGFEFGEEINVATGLFVQEGYPIRPIYRNMAEGLYDSKIVSVNFEANPDEALKEINNFVATKTNFKIKNILNEVPISETKIIIASALYFNANWEQNFFHEITKRKPFFTDGKNSKPTIEFDMMSNGGNFPYYKDANLGCEILGLPYKGNRSTFYVVMPFESTREKLHDFESKITESDLNRLVKNLKITEVVIGFPRMKIEDTIDLKESLKFLGVPSLFDQHKANLGILSPGLSTPSSTTVKRSADAASSISKNETLKVNLHNRIGGIGESIDNIRQSINSVSTDNAYQNPGLYADQVIHKVFIDVTETGTEAAAATAVSLSRSGKVNFRADVPFLFFIRHDETDTILFWGSVTTPIPNYKIL